MESSTIYECVETMKLFSSFNTKINKAYIITIKGHELSERYSKQAQQSCVDINMPFQVWDAFDGTKETIVVPEHSKNSDFINIIKITNHRLTKTQIANVLSHCSLWALCAKIDEPIVILEHDAIMIKKITEIHSYNSIVWLGGIEWASQEKPICPIPLLATDGPNFLFSLRAQAYAIDPPIARNLLSHIIKYGIYHVIDFLMRADIFNITHQGLIAYDKHFTDVDKDTTIVGESTRNDNLIY